MKTTKTKNMKTTKWNGDADLANIIFGENYGIDWKYIDTCNSYDIKVDDKIIKIGDVI